MDDFLNEIEKIIERLNEIYELAPETSLDKYNFLFYSISAHHYKIIKNEFFSFDLKKQLITQDNIKIYLPKKQAQVFYICARHLNKVVSPELLMNFLYKDQTHYPIHKIIPVLTVRINQKIKPLKLRINGWGNNGFILQDINIVNKRIISNKYVTINNTTKCIKDWLIYYKLDYPTFYNRLDYGWGDIEALTTPKQRRKIKKSNKIDMFC